MLAKSTIFLKQGKNQLNLTLRVRIQYLITSQTPKKKMFDVSDIHVFIFSWKKVTANARALYDRVSP
ncbi:MAG: hypothetical protein EB020_14100, partial [Proteobacteria bacterium]|nr:hypothetical protein [Pseudomonadota bacterium]